MHNLFSLNNYDYELPQKNIAYFPVNPRHNSKLLIYKPEQKIIDDTFYNLPNHLPNKALLILNNTKTLNSRFLFFDTTHLIEIFFISHHTNNNFLTQTNQIIFNALIGNKKKWKSKKLILEKQINNQHIILYAEILKSNEFQNTYQVQFTWNNIQISMHEIFIHFGTIPIPPYIKRNVETADLNTYQTIFSKIYGSIATPTAGLHFTENIFNALKNKNIQLEYLTLHINADTFKPIKDANILKHKMHGELIYFNKKILISLLNAVPNIFAVGTTTLRALESIYLIGLQIRYNQTTGNNFHIKQFEYENYDLKIINFKQSIEIILAYIDKNNLNEIQCLTEIMISPNYKIQSIKGLITNFHQPKSTLLLIVQNIVGIKWKEIYNHALQQDYRFLSYGDANLLYL